MTRLRVIVGRNRLRIAVLCVLVAAGLNHTWRATRPPPPLELSLWYWHQPFHIPPAELRQLKTMGVRRLFVRAGGFRKTDGGYRLTLPQSWQGPADGIEIHLVFNFDPGIIHDYAHISNETLCDAVVPEIRRRCSEAARAGLHVGGIQFDFDCPTSRLALYADLLHRIRKAIQPASLSITALPTWYNSFDIDAVLREVDFAVPQYYEAAISRDRRTYKTVSHLALAERGLQAAGRKGAPFFAGIPAYGHTLVYNARGTLVGIYHDMGLRTALRYPAFRLVQAYPSDAAGRPAAARDYIGEDIYDLEALTDADNGQGRGWHLLYEVPAPELFAQHLALLRKSRPQNCQGAILFRYPEPGATDTLALSAIAAALRGEIARPALSVQIRAVPAPWEQMETGDSKAGPPVDVTVRVTNTGSSGTFLAPDGVTVTLALDRAGFEEPSAREGDKIETFAHPEGMPTSAAPALRTSAARANVLQIQRLHLAAGETALLAAFRVPPGGASRLTGQWTARCPGGYETVRGAIPAFNLGRRSP